jgi:hypothetical protein
MVFPFEPIRPKIDAAPGWSGSRLRRRLVLIAYAGTCARIWSGLVQDVKEIDWHDHAVDPAEITEADVLDLEFEAEGELQASLNDAYI